MDAISWGMIFKNLLGAFAGTAANPFAVGGVLVLGTALFFFLWKVLKDKFTNWIIDRATKETEQGKGGFVHDNAPKNEGETDTDNKNRSDLEHMGPPAPPVIPTPGTGPQS